jgi:hypothetical protein
MSSMNKGFVEGQEYYISFIYSLRNFIFKKMDLYLITIQI